MRIPLLLVSLIAVVSSSTPAVPQAFPVPDRRARLESAFGDIDRQFTDFIKTAHVPGAAWGIIIDGELAHSGAAGVRDVVSNAPVDADTVFRIASMTKSFTAMAILRPVKLPGPTPTSNCDGMCPASISAISGTSRSAWPRPMISSRDANRCPSAANKATVQAGVDVSNARITRRCSNQ